MRHVPIQVLDRHCMVELTVIYQRKNTELARKIQGVHNNDSQKPVSLSAMKTSGCHHKDDHISTY